MSPRIPPHLGPVTPDSSTAPSFSAPTRPSIPPEPPRAPRHQRLPRWIGLGLGITALVVLLPILALRWLPPPTSAFMLQSPVKPVQYTWVRAARISDAARRAVLASEDQKFYDHAGFDLAAIQDAIEFNQRHDRTRGASTISQQTAKNLFLWPGGGYFRKGAEAGLTVLIELLWPKARIVEIYLNIAEFGPGIYGVEAAAQHYFGKPAAALTAPEAARLAAVLPNPRGYSVTAPGPHVLERSRWILQQMRYGAGVEPDGMQPPEGAEQKALPEADDGAPVPVEAPGDRWSLADTQAPKAGADIQTRRLQEPEALEAMPLDDGADDLPWTTEPLPSPASTDADT